PQYKELQTFHEKHGDSIVVIGFPSNQFGGQEPGSETEIKQFCEVNYNITFLLTQKAEVKGKGKHPVYKWLSDPGQNGWNSQEPGWNFCKYLINEKGELVGYYGSSVGPFDKKIQEALIK